MRHGVTGTATKDASHTYNKKFSHAIIVIPNTFAGAKLLISYQTTKQKGEEAHADDRRKAQKQPFVSYDKQRWWQELTWVKPPTDKIWFKSKVAQKNQNSTDNLLIIHRNGLNFAPRKMKQG